MGLKERLAELATRFAEDVVSAVGSSALGEIAAATAHSGAVKAVSGETVHRAVADSRSLRARLPRRSAADVDKALADVVRFVGTNGKRAEEIRVGLKLDVREIPRVLREGLRKRVLRATGQKRAKTYFAAAKPKKQSAKKREK